MNASKKKYPTKDDKSSRFQHSRKYIFLLEETRECCLQGRRREAENERTRWYHEVCHQHLLTPLTPDIRRTAWRQMPGQQMRDKTSKTKHKTPLFYSTNRYSKMIRPSRVPQQTPHTTCPRPESREGLLVSSAVATSVRERFFLRRLNFFSFSHSRPFCPVWPRKPWVAEWYFLRFYWDARCWIIRKNRRNLSAEGVL